jgi:hypothetical protein
MVNPIIRLVGSKKKGPSTPAPEDGRGGARPRGCGPRMAVLTLASFELSARR